MCTHIAARGGFVEILKELLRAGANVQSIDGVAGRTALHLSIEYNSRNVFEFLATRCRLDLEARTWGDLTAYQMALQCNRQDMAKILLRSGAKKIALRVTDDASTDSGDEFNEETDSAYRAFMAQVRGNPILV